MATAFAGTLNSDKCREHAVSCGDPVIPDGEQILLLVNTYVAASEIEGVGVFAAEPIAAGTTIWQLDPAFDRLVPMEKYQSSPPYLKQLLDRYAYPSPDRPGFLVYEVDNGRFMNHAETPNTDFSRFGGGTALADIAAGEELTCNYREFFEDFAFVPNAAAGHAK